MKSILIKGVLVLILAVFAQTDVLGQSGRFGNTPEDSIRALRNYSLYADRHRQGNFEDALPFWRVVFTEFPRVSKNIYIWGQDLMEYMIENADSEEQKKAYLDTAMMMFDQRIEHYNEEANVLGRKGVFYFKYNNNVDEAETGYEALSKAIELSGNDPSPAVVATYMNVTVGKFSAGLIDNEEVITIYSNLMEKLESAPSSEMVNKVSDMVEDLFANSGAADCDALVNLFSEQVQNSPEDMELLNKVNDLLDNAECTESDLYLTVTAKIHELEPSSRSALNLSAMYKQRGEEEQVIDYLKQAIELQEDPLERANYYLELAFMANQQQNDKQLSRQYAQEALSNNPALGRAHLHIGSLYASESSCFGDPFKDLTVFWVAVDRFNEAKRVDPSLTEEANNSIATYSKYFPDNETIFFHELSEGQSYKVECWINETTRVRPR